MAIPGTRFQLIDQSYIPEIDAPVEDSLARPIFMTHITSDKGTEDDQTIMGKTFYTHYGTPSFEKHGQVSIQAGAIVNAGGRLYIKRIVAEDSRLANIGVLAKVTKVQTQKTDNYGNPLYLTTSGDETTDPNGNSPILVQGCKISYELQTVNIAGNDVDNMASAFLTPNAHTNRVGEDGKYALCLITDVGRGVSKKKFRMSSDTNIQKSSQYFKNIIEILEDNEVIETWQFTIHPDIIENDTNINLQNIIQSNSTQVRARIFEDEIKAMIENISYIIGDTDETYKYGDILFGCDNKGNTISNVVVDNTIDLRNAYGISLIGGSNGLFGDAPIKAATYASEVVKFYNGQLTDNIYDLDNTRINFVLDANFDPIIKRAIEDFVTFREDVEYLRDLGIGLKSLEEIKIADKESRHNIFGMSYHNSWDVYDPYTKKQITVTIMYSLAPRLVRHFLNGINRPLAGILHEIVFPEVIKGTVNFIPKQTPAVDQKKIMENMRINYCSYLNNRLVLETQWTSQEEHTQLSYGNNMFAIHELINAIREHCPKSRYNFLDGDDLTKYVQDVQQVIDKKSHNFLTITPDFTQDPVYTSNKIFYAVLKVQFRNYGQAEYFKIIALPS